MAVDGVIRGVPYVINFVLILPPGLTNAWHSLVIDTHTQTHIHTYTHTHTYTAHTHTHTYTAHTHTQTLSLTYTDTHVCTNIRWTKEGESVKV